MIDGGNAGSSGGISPGRLLLFVLLGFAIAFIPAVLAGFAHEGLYQSTLDYRQRAVRDICFEDPMCGPVLPIYNVCSCSSLLVIMSVFLYFTRGFWTTSNDDG